MKMTKSHNCCVKSKEYSEKAPVKVALTEICFIGLNRNCQVSLWVMKHDASQLKNSYLVHLSPHVISQQWWTPGNILLLRTPKLKQKTNKETVNRVFFVCLFVFVHQLFNSTAKP